MNLGVKGERGVWDESLKGGLGARGREDEFNMGHVECEGLFMAPYHRYLDLGVEYPEEWSGCTDEGILEKQMVHEAVGVSEITQGEGQRGEVMGRGSPSIKRGW